MESTHEVLRRRDEWMMIPDRPGTWLHIDSRGNPYITRVYAKGGKVYAVQSGYRSLVRYGFWFPLGPVPSACDLTSLPGFALDSPESGSPENT